MIYASSRLSFKQQLGSSKFSRDIVAVTLEDLSLTTLLADLQIESTATGLIKVRAAATASLS